MAGLIGTLAAASYAPLTTICGGEELQKFRLAAQGHGSLDHGALLKLVDELSGRSQDGDRP